MGIDIGEPAIQLASSVITVFAMMMAPASRRFFVSVASYGGIRPSKARAPPVVGMSVVWMLSLSAMGMPWSGPRTLPSRRSRSRASASARARGFTAMTAFSVSSYRAMRVSDCSTSSRDVTRPCSMAVRMSAIVASTTEKAGAGAAGPLADAPGRGSLGEQGRPMPRQG